MWSVTRSVPSSCICGPEPPEPAERPSSSRDSEWTDEVIRGLLPLQKTRWVNLTLALASEVDVALLMEGPWCRKSIKLSTKRRQDRVNTGDRIRWNSLKTALITAAAWINKTSLRLFCSRRHFTPCGVWQEKIFQNPDPEMCQHNKTPHGTLAVNFWSRLQNTTISSDKRRHVQTSL